ncbi:MAG: hypothetical protein AB1631_13065 [Acidobacteriota bacterium]
MIWAADKGSMEMSLNLNPAGEQSDNREEKERRKKLLLISVIALAIIAAVALFWFYFPFEPKVKITGCHSVSVDGAGLNVPPGVISFDVTIGGTDGRARSYKMDFTYANGCLATARATRK